jgi:glycosyltransferase involved in cell wall biosynthesis
MPPRVLVMTTYYHPIIGGVETHARQLVQHLHRRGFGVQVVTKRIHPNDPVVSQLDDVTVHRVGPAGDRRARGKWTAILAFLSQSLALKDTFDAIVCVDYRGIGVAAVGAGWRLGRPVILQAATAGVLASAARNDVSGVPSEKPLVRIAKAPARVAYRRGDEYVCIGRDIERETLNAGIARDCVHYLPHGVNLRRFRPASDEERRAIRHAEGWPADRPIVLFVGRLSTEKGVLDLLEAWRLLDARDAWLVLVGPDMPAHPWDAGEKARAFVATHQLGERVKLYGPSTDTAPLHRAADLFVQPSHFESFGISVIEAMASGVPVVAAEVGGMRDFLVDGDNALLHRPRSPESLVEALRRAFGDPALRNRLADAGLRTVREQFDEEVLFDRYAALIESAVARR